VFSVEYKSICIEQVYIKKKRKRKEKKEEVRRYENKQYIVIYI
jgi:hypothetical protein